MNDCPDIYYSNCSNSPNLCKLCCAGFASKSSKLLYSPILDHLADHPFKRPNGKPKLRRANKVEQSHRSTISSFTPSSPLSSIPIIHQDQDYRKSWSLSFSQFSLIYPSNSILSISINSTNYQAHFTTDRVLSTILYSISNNSPFSITPTAKSGSIFNDGDSLISFQDNSLTPLRLESKFLSNRNSWYFSVKQYLKGIKQNISVFALTICSSLNSPRYTVWVISDSLLEFVKR